MNKADGHTWGLWINEPVPYREALEWQHQIHEARRMDRIPDTVLWLQHTPVITLGRRGREDFLQVTPEALEQQGIELITASRGGDVTYHGPGQWVMYPILHLGRHEADAHGYLYNLEETAIRTATDFGVKAWRREGKSGAWTDAGKIAAIGFHIKRWVTMHGMSFNACVDLSGFDNIVPCGLVGEPVTSLETILGGNAPALNDVRQALARNFEAVFGRSIQYYESDRRLPEHIQHYLNPLEGGLKGLP